MSFIPIPCPPASGGGGGTPGPDVEQTILCDVGPDGEILGTALAVYEYDGTTGNPVGLPTFVDPVTGIAYIPQGILQPCPGEVGCLPPMQFCFTTTGTTDEPGRQYDLTFDLAQGFSVESITIDGVTTPLGTTWSVVDPDGVQFATDLQNAIQGLFPDQTVTVTPPGIASTCGDPETFSIHIECALASTAPTLVQLRYNAGQDLIQNPGYLTTPPTDLSTPSFVYMQRQDAGGTLNCTSVANRGWETNDLGDANRDFEIWGTGPGGLAAAQNTTPTPRGTPVQEITADINDTGPGPTIWQTFQVTSPGIFKVRLVHGARDAGEQHTIRLSTGDTNDTGPGDIINNVTFPPSVTNSGGPNPWTTFSQDIPLAAGIYTFSFTTTNPVGPNRGGLFTDMRVYQDAPGTLVNFVNDDNTCTIPVEGSSTTCEFWQPRCAEGAIVGWARVSDGTELTNAAFWTQVPAPVCCTGDSGGSPTPVAGNLSESYEVCGIVGGVPTTLERHVITNQSGGILSETFVGPDGLPVVPTSYTIGSCAGQNFVNDEVLCDQDIPFIRKYIQTINPNGTGNIASVSDWTLAGQPYTPGGLVQRCGRNQFSIRLCDDDGNQPPFPFIRTYNVNPDGTIGTFADSSFVSGNPYVPTGSIVQCDSDSEILILCDVGNNNTKFVRSYRIDPITNTFHDITDADLAGLPYVATGPVAVCPDPGNDVEEEILCDDNGPFIRAYRYDTEDGGLIGTTDLTLAGGLYVPVGTVTICSTPAPPPTQVPVVMPEVVCYEISPGVQGQLAVILCEGCADQTPQYFDIGTGIEILNPTLLVCDPETVRTPIVLGELCASAPDPNAPPLSFSSGTGTLDFVEGPDNTFTATNFQGSGVDVTIVVDPLLGAVMIDGVHLQLNGGGSFPITVNFSQPVTVRGISFGEMDASFGSETFQNYTITPTGVTGALTLGPGPAYLTDTTINDGNPDGEVQFNTLTNTFTFQYNGNGLGTWVQGLRFEMPNPATVDQTVIAVKCDGCPGGVTYFNKETGLEVVNPTIVDCPSQTVTIDESLDVNVVNGPIGVTLDEPIDVNVLTIPESAAQTVAGSVQRQTGAGNIVIPAGAKSITFIATAGAPTAQVGAGPVVAVPAGATLTWSVDDRNQALSDAYTFTGGAADDFIVITTT